MNWETTFATDTATLAVFDPGILQHQAGDEPDWWCLPFGVADEVGDGRIVLVALEGDGIYKCRGTDGDLTAAEQAYAYASFLCGLEVVSGVLMVGPGEYLSGMPAPNDPAPSDDLFRVPHPCGTFDAEVYAVAWQQSPEWFVEEGVPVPATAPADFVVCLRPRSRFTVLDSLPQFLGFIEEEGWLFPDAPRRIGPEPGMELTTTVLIRGDQLVLKPCGPLSYRPVLPSIQGLAWRDKVGVKVMSVDHDAQEMAVTLVKRVN